MDTLVAQAQRGDAVAFSALYERYARRVYAYCLSRVRRPADAEDLTQVTFLKAVEALPRYEPRGLPFDAWLFTLARNAVIDSIRSRREHAVLDELRDGALIVHEAEDADAADALAASLPFLTVEQRQVIALRFFAGLSARETARITGRDEAAVRALQYRAVAALRRRIEMERRNDGGAVRPALRAIRARAVEP